jgi:hypothetical protein
MGQWEATPALGRGLATSEKDGARMGEAGGEWRRVEASGGEGQELEEGPRDRARATSPYRGSSPLHAGKITEESLAVEDGDF